MKRFALMISLVVVAALLTGCLAPKINVLIKPKSIELTAEQLLEDDFVISDIKIEVKTSGLGFDFTIDTLNVQVLDDDDEELWKWVKEIKEDIPIIVPGWGDTYEVPDLSLKQLFGFDVDDLPIGVPVDDETYQELLEEEFTKYYNENWKDKEYEVVVRVTGKNPTEDKAKIQFKSEFLTRTQTEVWVLQTMIKLKGCS